MSDYFELMLVCGLLWLGVTIAMYLAITFFYRRDSRKRAVLCFIANGISSLGLIAWPVYWMFRNGGPGLYNPEMWTAVILLVWLGWGTIRRFKELPE